MSNIPISAHEHDVSVVNSNDPGRRSIFNFRALAFTSGLSFGLMSSIIEYVYIFSDVVGPGTLLKAINPGYYFIIAGGFRLSYFLNPCNCLTKILFYYCFINCHPLFF